MFEDFDGGFREARAVYDRSVIQFVGNDQVFFTQDCRHRSRVGHKAGLKNHAGLDLFKAGDLFFEVHVHLHGSSDGTDGTGAHAEFSRGDDCRAAQRGMGRQSEIVIRTEIDHFLTVVVCDGLLFAFQDLQAEIKMPRLQIFDCFMQVLKLRARGCAHDFSDNLAD